MQITTVKVACGDQENKSGFYWLGVRPGFSLEFHFVVARPWKLQGGGEYCRKKNGKAFTVECRSV